jgi:D-alanyl-D-alanine carboxypeptidase
VILARAIIHDLPEYEYFVHIPSIRYGRKITQNFNRLIGRYPGADGFKTGFICASGYNLVASATRNGKRLIAVVLGASSGQARAVRAAQLLERGFASNNLSWLRPTLGTVDALVPIDASPPNLHDEMCGGKRHKPSSDEEEETVASSPGGGAGSGDAAVSFFTSGLQPPLANPAALLAAAPEPSEPIPVYTGPTRTGVGLIAAVAADSEKQTVRHHGRKSRLAEKKSESAPKPSDPPSNAEKPATTAANPKLAPKSAAKPAIKPAPKSTSEAQPADQKNATSPHS